MMMFCNPSTIKEKNGISIHASRTSKNALLSCTSMAAVFASRFWFTTRVGPSYRHTSQSPRTQKFRGATASISYRGAKTETFLERQKLLGLPCSRQLGTKRAYSCNALFIQVPIHGNYYRQRQHRSFRPGFSNGVDGILKEVNSA